MNKIPVKVIFCSISILTFMFIFFPNTYSSHGEFVFQGGFNYEKVSLLKSEMSKHDIRELTFRYSSGGGSKARNFFEMLKVSDEILKKEVTTKAIGFCESLCAVFFLNSEKRVLLPSYFFGTRIMIHPVRDIHFNEVDYGLTDRILKSIHKASKGKFPMELLERVYDHKNGITTYALFIYRDSIQTKFGKSHVFVCDEKSHQECEPIYKITPQDLGMEIGR